MVEIDRGRYFERLWSATHQPITQLVVCPVGQSTPQDGALSALRSLLTFWDEDTAGHSMRVLAYSLELARAMRCTSEQLREVALGAYLHDIGKITVDRSIVCKPAKLNDEERMAMSKHPSSGYELVRNIADLNGASHLILAHHERYDGSGYPGRLRGSEIPVGARLLSVADVFDAITTDRTYRRARPFWAGRSIISQESGCQFDPEVVQAFLSIPELRLLQVRAASGDLESLAAALSWTV